MTIAFETTGAHNWLMSEPTSTGDAAGSFRSHANYLRAFANVADFNGLHFSKGLTNVASRAKASLPADTRPASSDLDQVHKSLLNAWGTEIILGTSSMFIIDDELKRLSNNWAVVQAYYVLYHATQALAASKGMTRPQNHQLTQRLYGDFWLHQRFDLAPWTVGHGSSGCVNLPSGATIDEKIHPWTNCSVDNRMSLACLALRTTRQEEVSSALKRARELRQTANRKAWKEDEQLRLASGKRSRSEPSFPLPRLDALERQKVENKIRPFGLIDYLYRLRIKANYVDVSTFTDGPEDTSSSSAVNSDLRYLVASSMLVHELRISALVGQKQMYQWMDSWLRANSAPQMKMGLVQRRGLI
jgi:hypothetical protein